MQWTRGHLFDAPRGVFLKLNYFLAGDMSWTHVPLIYTHNLSLFAYMCVRVYLYMFDVYISVTVCIYLTYICVYYGIYTNVQQCI